MKYLLFLIPIAFILLLAFQTQAAFPGWNNITIIYYNPSQDDSLNKFLEQAATELRDHLQKVDKTKTLAINTSSRPASGAIYLEVNPALSANDEAFKLYSDSNGIYITGKTPIACRHGAYALLEKLGFRWFFKSPVWNVTPGTLISLDLNEVQEPFYLWRSLWLAGVTDYDKTNIWTARNRLYGAKYYYIGQNYYKIIPATEYTSHSDWFLNDPALGTPTSGWQLKTDHSDVITKAKDYARTLLSSPAPLPRYSYAIATNDKFTNYSAIPINPNDGGENWRNAWSPYDINKDTDWQEITDKVFSLANEVAKDFPDTYISVLSYASLNRTPTIPKIGLQPNILAVVTKNGPTAQVVNQQIDGLLTKGIKVGVYDFLEGYGTSIWTDNTPGLNLDLVQALASYAQKGVKFFNAEIGDGWANKGLTAYTASRMLWNPNQDFNALLADFYTKAFGPASEIIKTYYNTRGTTATAVGSGFKNLSDAESLVSGNNEYLERIRQLEYYQRFLWLWHVKKIANLSIDELKSFYTFVTKLKSLYVINYSLDEPALRAELGKRGLTDSQINALQNFTPPSAAEAAAYLNEALTAFNITIYAPGDLNKDKKVDITDVSILMSNWGRTDSAALQQCDINQGPNNISKDKIDIFDANLMMKNWTLTP